MGVEDHAKENCALVPCQIDPVRGADQRVPKQYMAPWNSTGMNASWGGRITGSGPGGSRHAIGWWSAAL